jgi:hypothetical protein
MTHYISKDVLVAEIEKRLDELGDLLPNASDVVKDNYTKEEANITGKYTALESFSKFLDTLEVKEAVLLTPEEIKKICTIYDNLKQERECATVLYNSDETFFNHVLMEYKAIASPKQ